MQEQEDRLLEYYDELFPVNKGIAEFIKALSGQYLSSGPVKALDISCAIGTAALQLARQGLDIIGIDSSEAMVQSANRRNHEPKSNVRFFCMGLKEIEAYFPPESFHILICLGDLLVKIGSLEEIRRLLQQLNRLLCAGGTLVFQLTNYDRIMRERIKALPDHSTEPCKGEGSPLLDIKTGRARMTRQFTPAGDGLLCCTTSIFSLAGIPVYSQSDLLYPISPDDLSGLLAQTGFTPETFFGDFDQSPLDEASLQFAGAARKKGAR
jgi:SAM-dependent methyltransferase